MEKKNQCFFSVCVPVYNVENYLTESIESVINQEMQDFEIILIDDGSQDQSGKICDSCAEKYPDKITAVHKENEGLLIARLEAVKRAKGEYLLFLDSDDFFYADAFLKIRETVEKFGADMVIFDFNREFPDGTRERITYDFESFKTFDAGNKAEIYKPFIETRALNNIWRKCIRRSAFLLEEDYKKYKGLNQGEDLFLSLPCVDRAKKIVYLKEALYGYRINTASMTANYTLKNYKDMQTVYKRADEYIKKWNLPQETERYAQRLRLLDAFSCVDSLYFRFRKKKIGKEDMLEAVEYISKDPQFLYGWETGRQFMPKDQRIICREMLVNKNLVRAKILLRLRQAVSGLKALRKFYKV